MIQSKKILSLFLLLEVSAFVMAQAPDWTQLSKRIVNETAGIKASDVVLISGGKHTMPLMEQVAAEVHRKGGMPLMVVESDVALRALWYDKPEATLAEYPAHMIELFKEVDYQISLPGSEDFKSIFKDADPKRAALLGSYSDRLVNDLSAQTHFSDINVGFPTKQVAETSGIDFSTYEKMHWAAVKADGSSMAAKGTQIMTLLKGAKNVKITSKAGTNLTFSMGDRLVFADDGILSEEERNSKIMFARYAFLPGGWMDFAPVESSVNGTVVIPQMRCNYEPVLNTSFTVKNGVLENYKASQGGECFVKDMAPHSGDKHTVSIFTLGLNPEMKVIQNDKTDFRSNISAGFLTMTIGGNNSQYNGIVKATGGFSFPLVNATLEIDGKVVIKDGKIVL